MIEKASQGINSSEQKINSYCKKLFLNLWTIQNPYTKEGKELCDTLIICGNKVIIFSVKNSNFMDASELKGIEKKDKDFQNEKYQELLIRWKRWYRNVIGDSKKQLLGAARRLKNNPEEIYKDDKCTERLQFLRIPDNPEFYLVAVADGLSDFIKSSLGEELGTFCLSSQGPAMPGPGFIAADINVGGDFVHVFDGDAIDILFEELDTISDFLDYLDERERFWRSSFISERFVSVVGEEEFVGLYFQSYRDAERKYEINLHDESKAKNSSMIAIDRGFWEEYVNKIKPERQRQNKDSYVIDKYIENYGNAIINNTLDIRPDYDREEAVDLLKLVVLENRLMRRGISDMIKRGIKMHREDSRANMYKNFLLADTDDGTAYLFLQIRPLINYDSNEEYIKFQIQLFRDQSILLRGHIEDLNKVNSLKLGKIKYIVGFVSHPLKSLDDFLRYSNLNIIDCSTPLSETDFLLIKDLKDNGLGIKSPFNKFNSRDFDVPK